jgi:hypothetical protein
VQAPRFQQGRKTTLRAELWLLIAAASLGVGACSQPVEGGETQDHVGRTIQPIVGGTTSGADQDAVVVLARFDNGVRVGLCTATLIAPNLAVTARHCVSQSDPSAACGADGQPVVGALLHGDRAPATLAVFEAPGGAAPDTTTDVGASARGKALVVDPATTFCNQDIAYIVLDRSLKGSIAPVRLAPPETSDVLTAVGFGITEAGGLPASRMQRRDLTLVGAGPMPLPDDARYGAGDAEFVVGESACAGDSGSPALAASGAVVGIASRAGNGQPRDPNNAASTCLGDSAHAVYAQFGAKQALALRAFAEAGAKPWLEGEPDPRIAPKSGPSGSKPGTPSGATAGESDSAPVAAPASSVEEGEVEPSASGGCSASSEPTHDAVEHALGVVAILLLALRLRRAGRRREDVPAGASSEKRIPYVDLGMRESFVSLPDDR